MDRIILVLTVTGLAVLSFFLWSKNAQLQDEISEEIEKGKISITSTILSETTEFTFMKVTNQFVYYMDKKGKDIGHGAKKSARWKALYKWEYPFHFGFKINEGWNWCIKVDEENGIVTLNAPQIKQLNTSSASPKLVEIFNSGFKKTQVAAQKWMQSLSNKKVKQAADAYLSNKTVQSSVKKSLAAFFQEILNDAHKDANPISKVIVNTVAKSSCDESG
ncbi:hypothetical protein [Thalassotalea agarivorans]|nr:hypothetical protein [Thalassotalea agarivorans]